jgi:hypothetical protein
MIIYPHKYLYYDVIMDLTIALTCEYTFDEYDCQLYLGLINIDSTLYEFIFIEHHINVFHSKKIILHYKYKFIQIFEYHDDSFE